MMPTHGRVVMISGASCGIGAAEIPWRRTQEGMIWTEFPD